jgi:hypothetical protein
MPSPFLLSAGLYRRAASRQSHRLRSTLPYPLLSDRLPTDGDNAVPDAGHLFATEKVDPKKSIRPGALAPQIDVMQTQDIRRIMVLEYHYYESLH